MSCSEWELEAFQKSMSEIDLDESKLVTATNTRDLHERVEELLGSEAANDEVLKAIEILYNNGFEFGLDIHKFWPDNMLELVYKGLGL